ncbi:MAG TPA: hypothetical protein VG815_01900 [Chloroflexota bacterium]|nr:hypothetical protein [Chloroflexota bacterium]
MGHYQNLNPAYDEAKPDLVSVTLGADGVRFADIVARLHHQSGNRSRLPGMW